MTVSLIRRSGGTGEAASGCGARRRGRPGLLAKWRAIRANGPSAAEFSFVLVVAIFAPLIVPTTRWCRTSTARGRWSRRTRTTLVRTDRFGRISLAVWCFGSRITSLHRAAGHPTTVGPLGLLLGVSAGYFAFIDMVLMRVTDIFIAFRVWFWRWRSSPGQDWSVVIISRFPPGRRLLAWRAPKPSLRQADFIRRTSAGVISPRHSGGISCRCLPSVIIRITMNMAGIILTAAGSGFLGLGAQPPEEPMRGDDLQQAHPHDRCWWVVTIPGAGDSDRQPAFNFLGDGLQATSFDPRNRIAPLLDVTPRSVRRLC